MNSSNKRISTELTASDNPSLYYYVNKLSCFIDMYKVLSAIVIHTKRRARIPRVQNSSRTLSFSHHFMSGTVDSL